MSLRLWPSFPIGYSGVILFGGVLASSPWVSFKPSNDGYLNPSTHAFDRRHVSNQTSYFFPRNKFHMYFDGYESNLKQINQPTFDSPLNSAVCLTPSFL